MTDPHDRSEATELANQILAGDTTGFDALYESVAPGLYAWASLRVPRSVAVDDFLQEVWLRGVRALHRDGAQFESFRAWIYQVARNVLLESLRRHLQVGRRTANEPQSALDRHQASVTSISTRLSRDDTMSRFLEYARALPEEDRELLMLCGIEGQPCVQVAIRVGLGVEGARKRWQRLRTKLRDSGWARHLLL